MSAVQCVVCGTVIPTDTRKELIDCACGCVSVDGCPDYVRILGDPTDYIVRDTEDAT